MTRAAATLPDAPLDASEPATSRIIARATAVRRRRAGSHAKQGRDPSPQRNASQSDRRRLETGAARAR